MAERPLVALAALALLGAGGCAGDPPPAESMAALPRLPERLAGRYAMIPANCGEVLTDDRLIVAPLRISFHESAGEVTRVEPAGPDRWRVTLAMVGEGESWTREEMLRAPPGGKTISLGPMLWHRCAV